MDSQDLQQGFGKSREGKDIKYLPVDEKIDVEIREIVRIHPRDFEALKNSFEEWAKRWD
jgi:hypothetical protein